MLQIYLFGALRLVSADHVLKFAALPKTLPLFAYLLLNRTKALPRPLLAYTLWPDVGEAEARSNLRRHLYELRRVLPAASADRPWLLVDNSTVQWNPAAAYWLDVADFEATAADLACRHEAVSLYGGDLLPELYEDWIFLERERLRNRFFDLLGQLMMQQAAQGDRTGAIRYGQQLLQHDPLREDVVRELMILRHEHGDRAGALQEYQRFVQRLRDELDVPPMLETSALYDAIARQLPLVGTSPITNGSGHAALRAKAEPSPPPTPHVVPALPLPDAPARTTPPTNLPAQLTSFIGREEEVAAVRALLTRQSDAARLLTITGPGGSGKTRLALEVGARLLNAETPVFRDGIFVLLLATVTDPGLVLPAIATTLGVKEVSGTTLLATLKAWLRDRNLLLILDNLEQLTAVAPCLAELLAAAPKLSLLVTSRKLLAIYGECEFQLPALATPEPDAVEQWETLSHYPAVALFLTRSRAVNPNFTLNRDNAAAIVEICRRLDGLPLALELAAARSKLFTPQAMIARLRDALSFLADSSHRTEARHQTLRATLDWSYALLDMPEQRLFARLAVFARRFTLDAVESVCSLADDLDVLDALKTLLDNSLVRQVELEGEMYFAMLVTVRDYARSRLPADELATLRERHLCYYLRMVQSAPQALYQKAQGVWLERLRYEEENLRAALAWAFAPQAGPTQIATGLKIVGALGRFWQVSGRINEANEWLNRAVALCNQAPVAAQVEVINQAGLFAQLRGAHAQALAYHERALTLARMLQEPRILAESLHHLGSATGRQGNYDRSIAALSESLAIQRTLGPTQDLSHLARTLNNLAATYQNNNEYLRSAPLLQESLALKERQGDQIGVAVALANLANNARLQGNYGAAAVHCRRSLELRRCLQDRLGMTNVLDQMAQLAFDCGRPQESARLFAASDAAHRAINASWSKVTRAEIDQTLGQLRTTLGEAAFDEIWQRGTGMALEEAVVFALREEVYQKV
ncbi:MAG: BTAD domain-containing putative transcriptional regulator [Caldilineaceae bacterium]